MNVANYLCHQAPAHVLVHCPTLFAFHPGLEHSLFPIAPSHTLHVHIHILIRLILLLYLKKAIIAKTILIYPKAVHMTLTISTSTPFTL
jgi:hypothetical protein